MHPPAHGARQEGRRERELLLLLRCHHRRRRARRRSGAAAPRRGRGGRCRCSSWHMLQVSAQELPRRPAAAPAPRPLRMRGRPTAPARCFCAGALRWLKPPRSRCPAPALPSGDASPPAPPRARGGGGGGRDDVVGCGAGAKPGGGPGRRGGSSPAAPLQTPLGCGAVGVAAVTPSSLPGFRGGRGSSEAGEGEG